MSFVPKGVICQALPKPVESLAWLIGTWRCENTGHGQYPTIKDFKYGEEITFSNVGQPMLNYRCFTWHAEKKHPMHQEFGFLRIKPGTNELSFLVTHNFGTDLYIFRD
jgi:hypothetical protein